MIYQHERVRPKEVTYNAFFPLRSPHPEDALLVEQYLAGRGLSPYLATANGWYPSISVDQYLRVVIPAQTLRPGHAYWQARALNPSARVRYQSPPGSRGSAVVMVKPFGKRVTPMAVIVEGPMDALAAAGEGYYGFALMGNTPPPEVLDHVIALCAARGIVGAVVVPDHDSSESGPHLAAYFACGGIPTSVIELSEWTESKDLAGASVSERAAVLSSRGGVKNWRK